MHKLVFDLCKICKGKTAERLSKENKAGTVDDGVLHVKLCERRQSRVRNIPVCTPYPRTIPVAIANSYYLVLICLMFLVSILLKPALENSYIICTYIHTLSSINII